MTRSAEFSATVSHGVRSAQPCLVVHLSGDGADLSGPRIGLVVSKAVGNAVVRHRVSRRLRHVALPLVDDMSPEDRLVIRALPASADASSARLGEQLTHAVRRARARSGARA